ncbi:unnamed protein product, partial [Sphagnum jensenii]
MKSIRLLESSFEPEFCICIDPDRKGDKIVTESEHRSEAPPDEDGGSSLRAAAALGCQSVNRVRRQRSYALVHRTRVENPYEACCTRMGKARHLEVDVFVRGMEGC